jgi:TolB-like protein
VHRFSLALIAFIAFVPLLAAGPPPDAPVVVVFPLQAPASLDRETTGRIATALGDQIAVDGHIRVIPSDPDAQRADFLATARKDGAEYYVTGYVTPLGNGATMIEQLVSVQTGLIIYSNSSQVSSLKDVRVQGDLLRTVIVERLQRGWPPDLSAAAPPPSSATAAPHAAAVAAGSPAPSEANIGGLFHHKKAAAPAPTASPSPSSAVAPEATATP